MVRPTTVVCGRRLVSYCIDIALDQYTTDDLQRTFETVKKLTISCQYILHLSLQLMLLSPLPRIVPTGWGNQPRPLHPAVELFQTSHTLSFSAGGQALQRDRSSGGDVGAAAFTHRVYRRCGRLTQAAPRSRSKTDCVLVPRGYHQNRSELGVKGYGQTFHRRVLWYRRCYRDRRALLKAG